MVGMWSIKGTHLDVPLEGSDRINGDRINGLVISPTYKWGINWGEKNPLILTIDPNFLGHPSTPWKTHDLEPQILGVWKMIFLFNSVIFR